MPEATVKQKYEEILSFILAKGLKVYHRKLNDGTNGTYDTDKYFITINRSIRYTIRGCYTLCHEFAHWQQHRSGEFPEFFKKQHYSKKNLIMVYNVEQDASRKALRMLWFWRIKYKPSELNPKHKKFLLETYKATYFK